MAAATAGSLEAVEDLALHAVLDLTPPQHELQDLVDGVLRVFLRNTGRGERRAPRHPTVQEPRHPLLMGLSSLHNLPLCILNGLTRPRHLLPTKLCSKSSRSYSFHPSTSLSSWYVITLHFTGEETKAQRG